MLERFSAYNESNRLFQRQDRVLLAVSGGIDSMVMLRLFQESGMACGVAHCHFGLRGEASDEDAAFVRAEADRLSFAFHVRRFDTQALAVREGVSIQMAARNLRYDWFYELADMYGYEKIAVAHNFDDVIETFFINLGRGTGIQGISGMKPVFGKIIRPLMFAGRIDIREYAEQMGVCWRDDASNAEDYYVRNYIRHHVLPVLDEAFPSFRNTMQANFRRFAEAELLYLSAVDHFRQKAVRVEGASLWIHMETLLGSQAPGTLLYEIVRSYGFGPARIGDIMESLGGACSGKQFLSSTHRIIRDREWLIVHPLAPAEQGSYYIEEGVSVVEEPLKLRLSETLLEEPFEPDRNTHVAQLDASLLQFPLTIRRWRKGDYFIPLGLDGMMKVSDFFINRKMSLWQKEQAWMILSGEKVVWMVGMRIDDRFKVTEKTTRVMTIKQIIESGEKERTL